MNIKKTLLIWSFFVITVSSHAALPLQLMNGEKLPSLSPVLNDVTPAVVNIATYSTVQFRNPLLDDPFFRRFFNIPNQPQQQQRRTRSAGSGVIVDAENGYILTNSHVIDRADEIQVTLLDGRVFEAKLLGKDPEVDIAVLQIEADKLTSVTFADSSELAVGDFVLAIGNPFGLGQTVTSGIVSALGRTGLGIEGYENFIQTDASINPGNSGGALINLRGELVGVNTAIIGPSGGNVGIGFAIPINMAKQVMTQLIDFGEVQRGQIGIRFQELTPELAKAFGIKQQQGALVAQVQPGSPAEEAGVKAGDVIIKVDGKTIPKGADLRNAVGLKRIGDDVELTLLRDGEEKTIDVEIGERSGLASGEASDLLEGAELKEIDGIGRYQGQRRVQISGLETGSQAERAGLQKGDIIVQVNRQSVTSIQSLNAIVEANKDQNLLLLIHRDGAAFYVVIRR